MADRERWYFDGWELTVGGGIRDWESRDGTDVVGAFVGDNHTVANRSGEMWRPKTMGPGEFTINVWVAGADRATALKNYRELIRAVARPYRMIRVARWLTDGERIFCDAELVGGIKPTMLGERGFKASMQFKVPGGVWQSDAWFTHRTASGSSLPKTLALTDLEPSTAPMEVLKYTIKGPITNPKLVDMTPGGFADTVVYQGTVPSGQSLVIDAGTWGTAGSTFTVNAAALIPTGRRLMTISHAQPGDVPTVQLQGSGGGSTTQLVVEGRRNYLC